MDTDKNSDNNSKNTTKMNYLDALLKDGGKPFQTSGKSSGEIAREKQFWKRVEEANKCLGLTSSHPSSVSYLDLLEDAPANVQEAFLKDAPAGFKERFYKFGGPRRQTEELAAREYQEMIYSNISDATGASREKINDALKACYCNEEAAIAMLKGASREEALDVLKATYGDEEELRREREQKQCLFKDDDGTS